MKTRYLDKRWVQEFTNPDHVNSTLSKNASAS